jgi:hypothetical protein
MSRMIRKRRKGRNTKAQAGVSLGSMMDKGYYAVGLGLYGARLSMTTCTAPSWVRLTTADNVDPSSKVTGMRSMREAEPLRIRI